VDSTVVIDPIRGEEVLTALQQLNPHKSPEPDDVHPLVLKELASAIAAPLTRLFNMSLEQGKLPSQWKLGHISPRYKGGPRQLAGSYRPISLTCIACKVMERLIAKRVQSYFEEHGLFTISQHGFRKNRSCMSNLLLARERWTAAKACGYDTDVIFIDFSKAFDKVPHGRLLTKLRACGIANPLLKWIADFLRGREFAVRVSNSLSAWCDAPSGVPQGSVLGPLLFLVYINDLPEQLNSPCLIYADDIKLWRTIRSGEDRAALQTDLDQLMEWTTEWTLPVNGEKCSHMHLGHQTTVNAYHLHGQPLRNSPVERDLGVMTTCTLKTVDHTEKVCTAARRTLGAIRRSFGALSPQAFTALFSSHVRPILEYGGTAAYPCTIGEMEKLERVQRAGTRMVGTLRRLPYVERLRALGLFTQAYRRMRGDLITVRKVLRGDFGPELQTEFPLRNCNRTRGHSLVIAKQSNLRLRAIFRLSRRAITAWNGLPAAVVEETSDITFKRRLDEHMENLWCQ
ncbi:RNA-directed DNA polymerase, partial [Streptococcus dysgalactiae]|uniref:RNA-directed DNA polymerase n=1 Tax=Streptococcus dysgalactiae TaxID=1334 RepID=UPI0019529FC0